MRIAPRRALQQGLGGAPKHAFGALAPAAVILARGRAAGPWLRSCAEGISLG
jgi:hypothetical protein